MIKRFTPESISRALFFADPMHTSCVENDLFDECDQIAICVTEKLSEGYSLETALRHEVIHWFGEVLAARAWLKPMVEILMKEKPH